MKSSHFLSGFIKVLIKANSTDAYNVDFLLKTLCPILLSAETHTEREMETPLGDERFSQQLLMLVSQTEDLVETHQPSHMLLLFPHPTPF